MHCGVLHKAPSQFFIIVSNISKVFCRVWQRISSLWPKNVYTVRSKSNLVTFETKFNFAFISRKSLRYFFVEYIRHKTFI